MMHEVMRIENYISERLKSIPEDNPERPFVEALLGMTRSYLQAIILVEESRIPDQRLERFREHDE